jgi:hypothetical protein
MGPLQTQCPLPSSVHICPPRQVPAHPPANIWQGGAPRVVVVGQGIEVLTVVLLVVVVVTVQQKPTMSGVSSTSPARQAGRTLTAPLKLPSR